jgi:hypothetical protein
VTEEFLDRSDVMTALEEVSGERVTEGMAGRGLVMPLTRTAIVNSL